MSTTDHVDDGTPEGNAQKDTINLAAKVAFGVAVALFIFGLLFLPHMKGGGEKDGAAQVASTTQQADTNVRNAVQGTGAFANAQEPQASRVIEETVPVKIPEVDPIDLPAKDTDAGHGAGTSENFHVPRGFSLCEDAELGPGSYTVDLQNGFGGGFSDTSVGGNAKGATVRFHNVASQEQHINPRLVREGSRC